MSKYPKPLSYGAQKTSISDALAVAKVVYSGLLTQGPLLGKFEGAVASKVGAKHGVAFNSATSALHAACLALGIGKNDVVWTSAISFVASANCAVYCGADVDFVDVDPATANISIEALEAKLEGAERNGKLPRLVIPVHFAGQPCDMERIGELAEQYGFMVLEDASHALGASYKEELVGSGSHSVGTVFSFHPVKMITTGEGGMCVTNSPELAQDMERIRSHGISRDPKIMQASIDGPWSYDQVSLGFNFRMTEFQAALGLNQFSRLRTFLKRRSAIADLYNKHLNGGPWFPLESRPDRTSSNHLFVVQNLGGASARKTAYEALADSGVVGNVHYRPIYRNSFYAKMGLYSADSYPGAERYYESCLSLPQHLGVTDKQVVRISSILRELS